MAYRKPPDWPIIDPGAPPSGYLKVGHHVDRDRNNIPWDFFVLDGHLLLANKELVLFGDNRGEYVTEEYEYPIAGIRWFVKTLNRFFLHLDHPGAVSRGKFNVRSEGDGETLGVPEEHLMVTLLREYPGILSTISISFSTIRLMLMITGAKCSKWATHGYLTTACSICLRKLRNAMNGENS